MGASAALQVRCAPAAGKQGETRRDVSRITGRTARAEPLRSLREVSGALREAHPECGGSPPLCVIEARAAASCRTPDRCANVGGRGRGIAPRVRDKKGEAGSRRPPEATVDSRLE